MSRIDTGLPHAWVKPKVADKLLRRTEAFYITDCGDQTDCHGDIDPIDRQQSFDALIRQCLLSEIAVDR